MLRLVKWFSSLIFMFPRVHRKNDKFPSASSTQHKHITRIILHLKPASPRNCHKKFLSRTTAKNSSSNVGNGLPRRCGKKENKKCAQRSSVAEEIGGQRTKLQSTTSSQSATRLVTDQFGGCFGRHGRPWRMRAAAARRHARTLRSNISGIHVVLGIIHDFL